MFRFWSQRFATPYLFDAADAGAGGGGGGTPEAKFTQADIDRIVGERLEQERQRKAPAGMTPEEKAEFDRLKKAEADRKQKDLEEKGRYDAALKSKDDEFEAERKTWREEKQTLSSVLHERTVRAALIAAASAAGAHKPQQIADLLEKRVKLTDTFTPEVLDAKGKPAFKSGEPLTVEQLVTAFLDEEPHLRKPANTGGSGSQGGQSTDAEGAADVNAPNDEVLKAREAYKAAEEKAKKDPSTANATKAHQAKRALLKAEEKAKQRKAA
jgi:hypothetical protein